MIFPLKIVIIYPFFLCYKSITSCDTAVHHICLNFIGVLMLLARVCDVVRCCMLVLVLVLFLMFR